MTDFYLMRSQVRLRGWEEGACQLRVYICMAHCLATDIAASYEALISVLWQYLPTPVSNAALRS